MKKSLLSVLAAAAAVSGANAAVEVSTAFTSDYYFRGVQFADAIIESKVSYTGDEFYAGVWFAEPIEAVDEDFGILYTNEVDFWIGAGAQVSDLVSLDYGVTAYYYPEVGGDDNPTWEGYVGALFDTVLAPSLYAYYDITLEVLTVQAAISHVIELDDVSSVKFGAGVGYVTPDEGDSAMYYNASVGYTYKLADNATFSASLSYNDGEDELSGGNWDDGFVASAGLAVSF